MTYRKRTPEEDARTAELARNRRLAKRLAAGKQPMLKLVLTPDELLKRRKEQVLMGVRRRTMKNKLRVLRAYQAEVLRERNQDQMEQIS